jgi:exosortase
MFLAAFYPAFAWMAKRFLEPDSYYGHGFIIPFVSLFLISKKRLPPVTEANPSLAGGLALLCSSLFIDILAVRFQIGFLSGIAMVTALMGLVLFIWGREMFSAVLYPILFLLLMIPLPKILLLAFAFKLKVVAAFISCSVLNMIGLPVTLSGCALGLKCGVLTVGNECSGISSLISIPVFSTIIAYFISAKPYIKLMFIAISLPIVMLSNVGRIMATALISNSWSIKTATDPFIHNMTGLFFWGLALISILVLRSVFLWAIRSKHGI